MSNRLDNVGASQHACGRASANAAWRERQLSCLKANIGTGLRLRMFA